jgi:WD40 repeat protein
MVQKKPKYTFFNPSGGVESMAVSPDGTFILLAANDGCVRKWDVAANKLERTFEIDQKAKVTTLGIDSKGETAAFGLSTGVVYAWDLVKSREIKRWKAHKGAVTALAVAPDGDRVVSCGEDDLALVWEAQSGEKLQKFTGHKGGIYAAKWCADGQNIITGGMDKKLFRWNAETGDKSDWAPTVQEKILSLAIDSRDRFVLVGEGGGIIQLLPLSKPDE